MNALRGPVYPALIDIVNGRDADFSGHLFDRETITGRFRSYQFTNQRRFTRSMLVWWAYSDPEQPLMDLDTTLEIEHIYARKRNEVHPLADRSNLEALGNKAMLEKRVNIRAADYQLADKRKYYEGYTNDKGAEVPAPPFASWWRSPAMGTSPRRTSRGAPSGSSLPLSTGWASSGC